MFGIVSVRLFHCVSLPLQRINIEAISEKCTLNYFCSAYGCKSHYKYILFMRKEKLAHKKKLDLKSQWILRTNFQLFKQNMKRMYAYTLQMHFRCFLFWEICNSILVAPANNTFSINALKLFATVKSDKLIDFILSSCNQQMKMFTFSAFSFSFLA